MRRRVGPAKDNTRIILLALTLVWAGMALASAGYGWVWGAQARLIATEGQTAQAQVIDSRISEVRRDGRADWDYYLMLRFSDATGRLHQVEVEVGRARHEAMPIGTGLTISYAPSDPQVVEIAPGDLAAATRRAYIAALVLGAVAAVFGLGWAFLRRRGRR